MTESDKRDFIFHAKAKYETAWRTYLPARAAMVTESLKAELKSLGISENALYVCSNHVDFLIEKGEIKI